jgi:carbonic anhydrase/acetyltransferase-like protein (isoleucine patch superfamily)
VPPFITHIQLLTFLRLLYFRGQGAKLSWSTHISPGARVWSAGLCQFGHMTYIGEFAHVTAHLSRGDKLLIAPVVIGDGVNVGAHANIGPGVTIGSGARIGPLVDIAPGCFIDDGAVLGPACQLGMSVHVGAGAELEPRTFLNSWTRVPDGELWGGDPGRKIGEVRPRKTRERKRSEA